MFCQNCGTPIQPGQSYCTGCARPLAGYVVPQQNRLRQHVPLLGILWIVYSSFSLLGGLTVMTVAHAIFGRYAHFNSEVPAFIQPILVGAALFLLLKAGLGIAAGIGLRQHENWARILAIVLGFFDLLSVPLGTILAIYTFWVLLASGAEREYRDLARSA